MTSFVALSHGGRSSDTARAAPLLTAAVLLVIVFLFLPLAIMFRFSLNKFVPGQFMVEALVLENYQKFISDEFYRGVLYTTIRVALVSTILSLIFGFPLAYMIARARSARTKNIMILLVVIPLLMGNAVRTAGWMVLLGDRGVVNMLLQMVSLTTEPIKILYTETAVLIGIVAVLLPYMIITLYSIIEGIDHVYEEAASSLGARPSEVMRLVIVPMAMPGVYVGSAICFILAMNAYATPVLIGGPEFHMMGPKVYEQITKVSNWPFGSALAFVLTAVTAVLTILSSITVQRRYGRM